jgi:two-component system, NtrC family, response regulator AtoC
MANEKILLVEDEKLIRWSLANRLAKEGYQVREADNGTEALHAVDEQEMDVVLLDYRLPGMDGLEVLRRLGQAHPELPIIMMTAYSTVESAIEAMKLGAFDYLNKPFEMDELLVTLQKALETTALKRELGRYRREQEQRFGIQSLVGQNPRMQEIFTLVRKIASSAATTILLQGESGTGKDLIAHTIHYSSDRAKKPFMNITCSALPENLLETELFGHEKGSFTDAKQSKKGLLELAEAGTVFLDEVGEMGLGLQSKLLRFLEEKTFKRVGGTVDIRVDVRIVAATNSNLEQAISEGRFRKDLFYRLKVIPIFIPPLRERPEDVPLLVKYFIDFYNREFKKNTRGITKPALQVLSEYPYPGNVRELKNIIERVMILENKEVIDVPALPQELLGQDPSLAPQPAFLLPHQGVVLDDVEKSLIDQALRRTAGNQTRAARLLGLTRDTLRYRLKKYNIDG